MSNLNAAALGAYIMGALFTFGPASADVAASIDTRYFRSAAQYPAGAIISVAWPFYWSARLAR